MSKTVKIEKEIWDKVQYKEKRYKRCKYQKSNYLFEDDVLPEDNKLATENTFLFYAECAF